MKGSVLIEALKKKFKANTDKELALQLGNSVPGIQVWKNRSTINQRQLAGLIHSASQAGARNLEKNAILPIVEFFHIEKCQSKKGANFELFGVEADNGKKHPYLDGVRAELIKHHGVYVFFDSRGQAIYAGKARLQKLWREMNLAFNRKRGAVQKIKRVVHPTRRQLYRTSDEKARQIVDREVPIHELASYFSAYKVADGMVNRLEAMLVRSFANNLLNIRMERFGGVQKKKQNKKKK